MMNKEEKEMMIEILEMAFACKMVVHVRREDSIRVCLGNSSTRDNLQDTHKYLREQVRSLVLVKERQRDETIQELSDIKDILKTVTVR